MISRYRLLLLPAAIAAGAAFFSGTKTGPVEARLKTRNPPLAMETNAGGGHDDLRTRPPTAFALPLPATTPPSPDQGIPFPRHPIHSPETVRAEAALRSGTDRGNPAHLAPGDQLTARDVIVDRDGMEHVRMDRSFRGLKVIGGDIVVHSRRGRLVGVSGELQTDVRPSLEPALSIASAISTATSDFRGLVRRTDGKGLCVYGLGDVPLLAYEIQLEGSSSRYGDAIMRYFVDAQTGTLLGQWNEVDTAAATGIGHSLFLGDIPLDTDSESTGTYRLVDTIRGGGGTRNGLGNLVSAIIDKAVVMRSRDNAWGNSTESDTRSAASDAHYAISKTWDYYKSSFGRSGIYNDNTGTKALIDVKYLLPDGVNTTGANAAWYGSPYNTLTFGMGNSFYKPFVSIDITAHEFTHGVTDATANFVNTGESGFLDEATSDIMGSMVEFYINNPSDPGDFYIGEKLDRLGGFLRSMSTPSLDLYSADCQYPLATGATSPYNDRHARSGIGNHFFYLLAEGTATKTFDGLEHATRTCLSTDSRVAHGTTALTGIGRKAAQSIWYRALTVYMTSSTNYAGARTATLSAAADLYGAGSTQYNAVAKAWTAVKVN